MSLAMASENYKWNNESIKSTYHRNAEALITSMTWKHKENIMDYGCGTGSFGRKYLFPLADEYSSNIFAVDVNEEMIKYAEQYSFHESVNYSLGNIMDPLDWSFGDEEMHKVLAISVLPFIKDFESFFRNTFHLLKKGGQLGAVFSVGRQYAMGVDLSKTSKWSSCIEEDTTSPGLAEWVCMEPEELVLLELALTSCGFKIIECQSHPVVYEFDDIEKLYDYHITLNPSLNRVPVEQQKDLMAHMGSIASKYIQGSLDSKPFVYNWNIYRIVAEKP